MNRKGLSIVVTLTLIFASLASTSVPRSHAAGSGASIAADPAVARNAARDPGTVLVSMRLRNAADRDIVRNLGTVIEDYGSFAVVAIASSDLESVARSRGVSELGLTPLESTISLREFRFDPLQTDPAASFATVGGYKTAPVGGRDYYLVQFIAPVRDSWLHEIEREGGEVIQYVPNQAFLVYASSDAIEQIANNPRVRWAGLYQPAFKLCPGLMWAMGADVKGGGEAARTTQGFGRTGVATYDIAVFRNANIDIVRDEVLKQRGTVLHQIDLPNNYFKVLRVDLEPSTLRKLINLKEVIAIDPYITPQKEDERASHIVAGNFTSGTMIAAPGYNPLTQFGVDGTNVTVSVVDDGVGIPGDGGFYITSSNTVNGPLRGASAGAQGHGHLNASIIAGDAPSSTLDPLGYNYGTGIAPKAHIVNIPLLRSGYTGVEADTVNDTVTTMGPNGILGYVTNNSWGNGTNSNAYDTLAAQYDGFVRDASSAGSIDPLVIVFSAGNQGASGLTRPKVAKNLISVAAGENRRTELGTATDHDNLEDMTSFSSRGPAADTRVKPDLAAPGDGITGGRSGTDALFGNIDTFHRWSVGTSHAAPLVAGAAALFVQHWKNSHAGANPSPAIVKAALINGTDDMTGNLASAARPNGAEGWGRLNLKTVINTTPTEYIDQSIPLSNTGAMHTMTGTVQDATKPFRVTLVWSDPPGVSDPALVNNLDLEVTVQGNTYRGNVFAGGLSTTGGSFDTRNNVENVFLPAGIPVGTPFTVRVLATAINGDGILGNADSTDQNFGLVVKNGVAAPAAVVSINTATLTAEGCSPANGAVDPGEAVSVDVTLSNIGTANTTNLVATLQATGGVTSPGAAQNYGALTFGGSAVTRTFTFTGSGSCGGAITGTLQLQDGPTNLGTVTFNFQLGTLSAPTTSSYSSGDIAVPILDNATSMSTINVPDTGFVSDVNVSVRLNHTWDADVTLVLKGPDNTSVTLSAGNGGSGDNYGTGTNNCSGTPTVFDDSAATSITAGTVPFAGTFKPQSPLSAFNGTPVNGTWTLQLSDSATGDTGTLGCWSMTIGRQTPLCTTPCPSGGNIAPVANAGSNQTVNSCTIVTLNGTGSTDPDSGPNPLTYTWMQTSGPTVVINNPTSATATFESPNVASSSNLMFQLTVNDGAAMTSASTQITVNHISGVHADTTGLYTPSTFFLLRNCNGPGSADMTYAFGGSSWIPLRGDWNGNGDETAGAFDPVNRVFYLKNMHGPGAADTTVAFGAAGDIPIVGDWDGNGTVTIGVYRPSDSSFRLKNTNTAGAADIVFVFGAPGANFVPIVGDWDGNGTTTAGLYQTTSGGWFLINTNAAGSADLTFVYGPPAGSDWVPVVGNWDGIGGDSCGLFQRSTSFYWLKNTNSSGSADMLFQFGVPVNTFTPMAGNWDGF